MTWLPTSPHGPLPVASWQCLSPDCPMGFAEAFTGITGHTSDEIRVRAVTHVTERGHPVIFRRGTAETIEPLATEIPGGAP